MKLSVKDLAEIPHVSFLNAEALGNRVITGVSTDSRTLRAGDLFFALKGANFDGHAFVQEAFARGARAAVVEVRPPGGPDQRRPLLVVQDSTKALGSLAHQVRKKWRIPVVAIGGSNGKTTTKEMIASVLGTTYTVLSTEGNLNNQVGVPQTLFRLRKGHQVAVVEIGTNHPGEVASLCAILEPTHGLVTNIGKEHLEFFGSVEGVAREEGDLYRALKNRTRSVAFVNADDPLVSAEARGVRQRFSYGYTAKRADVSGTVTGYDSMGCASLRLVSKQRRAPLQVQLGVPGEANAFNGLAAAAVGLKFRVAPKRIIEALENFQAASKRMEVLHVRGVTVFNDTYNANPDSTIAALRTLARAAVPGKKIAVLADMLELGNYAPEEHARVGTEAANLGIHYLLTFGPLARYAHDAAKMQFAVHYDEKNVLAEYLIELVAPGDAVLVKGSRGMRMEDVVVFFQQRLRQA